MTPSRLIQSCLLISLIALSGCAVQVDSIKPLENEAIVEEIQSTTFDTDVATAPETIPAGPVSLYEAMARAAKYSLEHRIKQIEQDIARARHSATKWDFYPQLIGSYTATERSNTLATSSQSVITGQESLEVSTSTDRSLQEASLSLTWNLLDICINYYSSSQSGNTYFITREQRIAALNKLLLDVRTAYYKAASAQKLLSRFDDFQVRARAGLATINQLEQKGLVAPLAALNRKKAIHQKLLQLQKLRNLLLADKLELARLMNIPPSVNYQLITLDEPQMLLNEVMAEEQLIDLALRQRPELQESKYHIRITEADKKKAFLRHFPSIELSAGTNYSSNSFLLHETWEDVGLKVVWKLLDTARANEEMRIAQLNTDLAEAQMENLAMAIISQVKLAYLDYTEAISHFTTTSEINTINQQLEQHRRNISDQINLAGIDMIQFEGEKLVTELEKDVSYARTQDALGRLIFSVGEDLFGDMVLDAPLAKVMESIRMREQAFLAQNQLDSSQSTIR